MARTVRDADLRSREARSKLAARHKPFWREIEPGLHLGYYKGPRGGAWKARRYLGAGRYHESDLGPADDDPNDTRANEQLGFAAAQKKAQGWNRDTLRAAKAGIKSADGYSVADALRDYLAHYESEGGRSLSQTRSIVNAHILPKLGAKTVAELTATELTRWRQELAAQPARLRTGKRSKKPNTRTAEGAEAERKRKATANRILNVLKAALNFAYRSERVPSDDAWRKVTPYRKVDAPVIRYLTEAEAKRLLNAAAGAFRRLVQAALLTGCRYGELARLNVADFDPDAGTLTIRTSKSGKARHVTLSDEGQKFFLVLTAGRASAGLVLARDNGAAWGTSHQKRFMAKACKAAKIDPPVSFHVLRHTHGSRLAMNGVPLGVIAAQLGHADTRMTEKHYAHLSPNYVADTIRAKLPDFGILAGGNVVALISPANAQAQ